MNYKIKIIGFYETKVKLSVCTGIKLYSTYFYIISFYQQFLLIFGERKIAFTNKRLWVTSQNTGYTFGILFFLFLLLIVLVIEESGFGKQ